MTPDESHWAPPLDVAEHLAREALADSERADYYQAPHDVLAAYNGRLAQVLRYLVDALDQERNRP